MMLFKYFQHRAERRQTAEGLYQLAMVQSREPVFYTQYAVPDTMDGRFDVLCVHIILMTLSLNRLSREGRKRGQALFDAMFRRMAIDLREMGVGDVGLSKHMQKMMKAFNGRAHAYHTALEENMHAAVELSVARNIYRAQGEAVPPQAAALADYILACQETLARVPLESFVAGKMAFPVPTQESIKRATPLAPERTARHA